MVRPFTAYEGQFCEGDRSGCAETSCYHGVQCFDVPAPGVGIRCGPCPNGYTGDGQNCIGMCVCGVCVCACVCVCVCVCVCAHVYVVHMSYIASMAPPPSYTGIDECAINSSLCQQQCIDVVGSYTCACFSGFQLEPNGTCVGKWSLYKRGGVFVKGVGFH